MKIKLELTIDPIFAVKQFDGTYTKQKFFWFHKVNYSALTHKGYFLRIWKLFFNFSIDK